MKKYLISITLFVINCNVYCQNWITLTNSSPNFTFSFPGNPNIIDTLHTKYYYYKLDTLIGFQVHEFDSAKFEENNSLFNEALYQTKNDTLRAITKIMLALSNSELISIHNINDTLGYKGLEIGLKYNELDAGRSVLCFIQFFYNNTAFISFTITGYEDDITRYLYYKDFFFNSISFQL